MISERELVIALLVPVMWVVAITPAIVQLPVVATTATVQVDLILLALVLDVQLTEIVALIKKIFFF